MAGPSFDNRDGVIWYNGELVDWRDAKVHVLNHGLHYASSVFEGERSYGGHIFKNREHTERLNASAALMGFDIPWTMEQLEDAKEQVLKANNLTDAYIRPFAWRGSEMMAVSAQHNKIHVAVAAWHWGNYFPDKMKGIRVGIADWKRPDPATIPCHAKAAGLYMICTLSKHKAEAEGYTDALMLDYQGNIAELTAANIFFVKDGALHTPKPDCFLDGITRRTAIDLAKARQIPVLERKITLDELADFEQCFVTGTAAEITPVAEIADYTFEVGELTRQLVQDYDKLVRGQLTL